MKTTQLINKTKFKHRIAGPSTSWLIRVETNHGEVFGCGSDTFNHQSGNWGFRDISRVLGTLGRHDFSIRFVRALLEFKNT